MKLKCIATEPQQDKNNGSWYIPNEEYPIEDIKRAKELLETKLFEEVKTKKDIKEDAKK